MFHLKGMVMIEELCLIELVQKQNSNQKLLALVSDLRKMMKMKGFEIQENVISVCQAWNLDQDTSWRILWHSKACCRKICSPGPSKHPSWYPCPKTKTGYTPKTMTKHESFQDRNIYVINKLAITIRTIWLTQHKCWPDLCKHHANLMKTVFSWKKYFFFKSPI